MSRPRPPGSSLAASAVVIMALMSLMAPVLARPAMPMVASAVAASAAPSASASASASATIADIDWIATPRPAVALRAPSPSASAAMNALRAEASADWTIELTDGTFHQTLRRWTRAAGWQLVWEAERDFPIDAQVTLRGNFLDALGQAMTALSVTDFPLQARIQPETRVVRIGRYLLDGERR